MVDIGALVLHTIIKNKDLDSWARVKLAFFDTSLVSVFRSIAGYYDVYNTIPNFSELRTRVERSASLDSEVSALESLVIEEEIDIDVAIDALIDRYTQTQTLDELDKFLDAMPLLSTGEIKEHLSSVVMRLDEQTHTSETVMGMNDILLFNTDLNKEYVRFPSGISNILDAKLGGLYRQEVILLGGKRGAGKSVVCANFTEAQYALGNSTVYFTIEMNARETFERMMSMRAGVSHIMLKQGTLSDQDIFKLVKVRAEMFEDADDLVEAFVQHQDKVRFESDLIRNKKLKQNQVIIIDDRELSIAAVDLHLQKLKARFGDGLKLAVIDYLNQITVPGLGNTMYDWTTQIFISKKLKELARKYDLCIVSPYQIAEDGGTRFAKGILDSCDVAFLLDAHDKDDSVISFDTTKIRGGPPLEFSVGINWDTLRIDPAERDKPVKKSKKKEKEESYEDDPKATFKKDTKEKPEDTPW